MRLTETRRRGGLAGEAICWTHSHLPSQSLFQSLPVRFKGFSGPVGSGKSAALCFEIIRQCFINRGRRGVLAAPTFSMLRDASLAALQSFLEGQDIAYEHRKADGEITVTGSASVVLLRSLDEPERLRGTNLAWFGIDELSYAREEAWLRLEARLRDPKAVSLCGFGVWTPQGHDWIYKRFIHDAVNGYGCVKAKPFENRHLLDKTPDYYERLESSYDPKFYRQEVLGEYLNSRSDRVYHCFNAGIHVVKHAYDKSRPLLWALDFNVAPMSSVLLQWKQDQLVAIDEIILERATTQEACSEFENRYRSHQGGLEIYGDASGRNMHTTGSNDYAIVQSCLHRMSLRPVKMSVPSKNPPVLDRVRKVNSLLTNAAGEVTLLVDSRCKELIKDLEEVLFKPDSGVVDKDRDPKRTHASDAMGYAIWELFGSRQKIGEMSTRLL